MLDEQSGETGAHGGQGDFAQHSWMKNDTPQDIQRSSGGASRFFYTAKASKAERNAGCEGMEATEYQMHRPPDSDPAKVPLVNKNYHPTVKPVALMEYLCKLTATPTGGIVLDPFAGSGSTGIAAYKTNRGYVLIDKDPDYCKIAEKRIQDERDKFALFEQNP
jgi:site-specific DNA-methyltransferase (adenine-specific)